MKHYRIFHSSVPMDCQQLEQLYSLGWELITIVNWKDEYGSTTYGHYFKKSIYHINDKKDNEGNEARVC